MHRFIRILTKITFAVVLVFILFFPGTVFYVLLFKEQTIISLPWISNASSPVFWSWVLLILLFIEYIIAGYGLYSFLAVTKSQKLKNSEASIKQVKKSIICIKTFVFSVLGISIMSYFFLEASIFITTFPLPLIFISTLLCWWYLSKFTSLSHK